MHRLWSEATPYPDVQRPTTQDPYMQETSATPGIAVQSIPRGERASRGVIHPPPAQSKRRQPHQPDMILLKNLTALEVVPDIDALPRLARPAPLLEDPAGGIPSRAHPAPLCHPVERGRSAALGRNDRTRAGRPALATAYCVRRLANAVPIPEEGEAVAARVPTGVVELAHWDGVVGVLAS